MDDCLKAGMTGWLDDCLAARMIPSELGRLDDYDEKLW